MDIYALLSLNFQLFPFLFPSRTYLILKLLPYATAVFSGIYTAVSFEHVNKSLIPFILLPQVCVGGLDLHDI